MGLWEWYQPYLDIFHSQWNVTAIVLKWTSKASGKCVLSLNSSNASNVLHGTVLLISCDQDQLFSFLAENLAGDDIQRMIYCKISCENIFNTNEYSKLFSGWMFSTLVWDFLNKVVKILVSAFCTDGSITKHSKHYFLLSIFVLFSNTNIYKYY